MKEAIHIFIDTRIKKRHIKRLLEFQNIYLYYQLFCLWIIIKRDRSRNWSVTFIHKIENYFQEFKIVYNLDKIDLALIYSNGDGFIIEKVRLLKKYFTAVAICSFEYKFYIRGFNDQILNADDFEKSKYFLDEELIGFLVIRED